MLAGCTGTAAPREKQKRGGLRQKDICRASDGTPPCGLVGATDGADELAWAQAGVVDCPPERLVLPAEVVEKTGEAFLCRPGISIDRAPDGSIRDAHVDRDIARVGDYRAREVHVKVFQAARKAIRDLAVLVPFSSRPSISATIQGTLTACSWRLGWRVASGHHWPMVR
jgi:hypothetical protein